MNKLEKIPTRVILNVNSESPVLCDKCGGNIKRKYVSSCPTDGKFYCEKCVDPESKIYNENFFKR